jgi:hypothetical protein
MESDSAKFLSSGLSMVRCKVTIYALATLFFISSSLTLAGQAAEIIAAADSSSAWLTLTGTAGFSPGDAGVTRIYAQEFNKGLIINHEGLMQEFSGFDYPAGDGSHSEPIP